MGVEATIRFPIAFEAWYRVLSTALGLPPSSAYVEVMGEQVDVRMGWVFRARFERSAVSSTSVWDTYPISRGVHGFAGRWLVNGAGRGILKIDLAPPQRARVIGLPVRLRELLVSVEDPPGLAAALGAGHGGTVAIGL